ncbi:hypothetical protein EDD21DRAFT_372841 [Dissophora ornata]|nr:hypothetical protein BGZ58_003583 [Dissophora ornata]KAI8602096.1 hypothetical protein EDD21DRAFT_372841 [Dissophora ornata]
MNSRSSTSNKRKRAEPPTLILENREGINQYFFDVPYYEWSLESFCEYEFDINHRQGGNNIAKSFLTGTTRIKDSKEVPVVIRKTAEPLSSIKQARIRRVWQNLFVQEVAKAAKERSDNCEAAKKDFDHAAGMIEGLVGQLEYGPFAESTSSKPGEPSEDCIDFKSLAEVDGNDALSNRSRESGFSSFSGAGGDGPGFLQATFSDTSDDADFFPDSNDNTGSSAGIFAMPPGSVNWIVGPGSISSQFLSNHTWIDRGVNISQLLANQRESAMRVLERLEDADLLAQRNFIYTPRIIQEVLSIEQWQEAVARWDKQYKHDIDKGEIADAINFALSLDPRTTHQDALNALSSLNTTKPITRIISNYLRTSALWETTIYDQLLSKPVNEDTFINNIVKPVMDGMFGDFQHITMH